ncbi:sigma 54-interacting transcriptional regulator [Halalkalibacter krulwichiae]|uniref:Transcriptional regulatory protein ZraR n=1 Tax=Halalkalibacter krulwichiae TaxID=199441 RepID=A0A1X9MFZ9_9BACI|nr:sigma 54-interacting transcriptional regulator [Halalkalibacter krulwichiae]ARK30441.1 Transcriptional regulatory protein ZraR [Halalkalibacter krulwichiae]
MNIKETVNQFARSFDQVESIVQALPFAVVLTNKKRVIQYYNSMFEKIVRENQAGLVHHFLDDVIKKDLDHIQAGTNIHLNSHDRSFVMRTELAYIHGEEHNIYLFSSIKELEDLLHVNREKSELLETVMELAYDGIVIVDENGYITMLSKEYGDFIGVDPKEAIGKHVTDIIENTRMHEVAKSGKVEIADLQKINGDYMIATRVPIIRNGEIKGAVGRVLFKNVGDFNSLYKRVNAIEKELKKYKGEFKEQNKAAYTFLHIIGKSKAINLAKSEAERAALSDSSILLLGESGTGKELFAHSIHHASKRSNGSFVKINCAAIPADLLESELFGYEEGSFTGAKKGGKKGKFEAADGGTIFLDEIGELPLHMQVKFLRVLQEKEVEKIGSTSTKKIDVRIIAATNRNLEEMIDKGEFRLDLYYRLNVVSIHIPSLRERDNDLSILSRYFIDKLNKLMDKRVQGLTKEAENKLYHYQWPGNIRELENVMERAMNLVHSNDKMIDINHLSEKLLSKNETKEIIPLSDLMEQTEKEALQSALLFTKGNRSKAAKLLKVSRTTFYEKLSKYELM